MAEPSFGEQIATLNSTLRAIEVRLALGKSPVEGLEDFKSSLDDMRLRLWGLLGYRRGPGLPGAVPDSAGYGNVPRSRRDLRSGSVSGRHPELNALKDAARELSNSIEQAQQHASLTV